MICQSKGFSNHPLAADTSKATQNFKHTFKDQLFLLCQDRNQQFFHLLVRVEPATLHQSFSAASQYTKTSTTAPITQSAVITPNITAPQLLVLSPQISHFPPISLAFHIPQEYIHSHKSRAVCQITLLQVFAELSGQNNRLSGKDPL